CPVEPGLSSPVQAPQRLSGRLRARILRLRRGIPQCLRSKPWAAEASFHTPFAPVARIAPDSGAVARQAPLEVGRFKRRRRGTDLPIPARSWRAGTCLEPRSLRGRSQPGCGIATLIVYAVRMFDAFWPVEPLRAGKPSKIRPRAATFSLRLFLPRRLLAAVQRLARCAAEFGGQLCGLCRRQLV